MKNQIRCKSERLDHWVAALGARSATVRRSRTHTLEALEPRIAMSADFAGAVGQLPGSSLLTGFLDTDRDPAAEIRYDFGLPNDQAVSGDWNGDGFDDLGMVRSQPNGYLQWFLDGNRDPHAEKSFYFGSRGDHVLVADFSGDGIDDIAVVRPNDFDDPTVGLPRLKWYLAKGPFDDVVDNTFAPIWTTKEYGFEGDRPVAGDWDNNGTATAGIVSQVPVYYDGVAWNRWYLEGSQPVDFGYPSDAPVVGDWDGNGTDNVGVVRERSGLTSLWYGDTNSDPASEVSFEFGLEGYQYVVGNWKADDTAPTAVVSTSPVPALDSPRANFVVTYADSNYIESSQFDNADLRISGPNGYERPARFENSNNNGRTRLVTYSIPAPGGHWDTSDSGSYTITVEPNQVCDISDNCVAAGQVGQFVVNFGPPALHIAFDGISLSRPDLERWSQEWGSGEILDSVDPDGDGISVAPFMSGDSRRETVISRIISYVANDVGQFGIEVIRNPGQVAENVGSTTIMMGLSTVPNPHIALDIDEGNENSTDLAFVGDESLVWGTVARIARAQADIAIHEAGHTWGLYHVVSGSARETMGWRYNNPQSTWDRNTTFLDRSFQILPGHGPNRMQNSFQVLAGNFGLNPGVSHTAPAKFGFADAGSDSVGVGSPVLSSGLITSSGQAATAVWSNVSDSRLLEATVNNVDQSALIREIRQTLDESFGPTSRETHGDGLAGGRRPLALREQSVPVVDAVFAAWNAQGTEGSAGLAGIL